MVRAGWSGPRFMASKLSHSASTSGPSAISQPIATKMSATCSEIVVSGCREPTGSTSDGSVTSTCSAASIRSSSAASTSTVRAARASLMRSARLADALAGLLAGLRRQCADLAVRQRQR